MNITRISIKRPTLVVVVFAILTFAGLFSFTQLNYELVPKLKVPVVSVVTVYPGASPSEVENSVTKKIEDAVASLENIKKISSQSLESISIITVELVYGTDADLSMQDAQRKVDGVIKDLPTDCEKPSLSKFDVNDFPVFNIGVTSKLPEAELYDLVDNQIKPRLNQVKGMARVNILGGTERAIRINVDANKLEAYHLSIMQVNQAIQRANLEFPTGKIKSAKGQTLIRLAGKFTSVEEIQNLIVKKDKNEAPVKIKDIAEVIDDLEDTDVLVRADGKSSIGILLLKQSDANAVELSADVRKMLDDLENQYKGSELQFKIASDSSIFTMEAADSVIHDLIIAVILVAFVMLFFLHSIRNSVIVLFAIPTSIVATFIVMYMAGFSLNMMTLLALSLVVGILVDDAIVVIENIHRHLEMGKSPVMASYDAIKEIGLTVASITLVIVVVFVPIAMTTGLVSDLLRHFSITVAVATLISLFVSFTLVPLLSSRYGKLEQINPQSVVGRFINGFERIIDGMANSILGILKWSFNHKIVTLLVVLAMFIASLWIAGAGFIGSEFMSPGDRGEFVIELELPKDASVEHANFAMREAENYIKTIPEVKGTFVVVGSTFAAQEGQTTAYKTEIQVKLTSVDERVRSTNLIAQETKVALDERLVGIKSKVKTTNVTGGVSDAPIQVILQGPELKQILKYAEELKGKLENIQGTSGVSISVESGNPEIRVEVNREKMANLSLDIATVGATLQTAFNGNDDSKFRDGSEEYDIILKLDQFDRQNKEDIGNITIPNQDGDLIRLKQFADIVSSSGPAQLDRFNRMPSVTVKSQAVGVPTGTIGDELKVEIAKMDMPSDVTVSYGGDLEMQGEAFLTLLFAFAVSIFIVYLIMVALYDSYVYPFVVMFSIPLAIIGALVALAMAKQTLSIFTILGIIMLIGLVAKNAILVVDFTNQLKSEGKKVKEALLEASETRFRPILMTTLAMVIGMLPIALAGGAGAEWKNGLAWALIGGLISSMFLTLVVVPVIYYIFDRVMERFGIASKTDPEIEKL